MLTRKLITASVVAAVIGCNEPPTSPAPNTKNAASQTQFFDAVTPSSIEVIAGERVATAPAIRVTDRRSGAPVPGLQVTFVPQYAGYVTNQQVLTDAEGIASPGEWIHGTRAGIEELQVWANGFLRLSFRATIKPDVPAEINANMPLDRLGLIGDATDVWLSVRDRFFNWIPNLELSLTFVSASGAVTNSTIVSDRFGNAHVGAWTLDSVAGTNSLTVSASGIAQPLILQVRGVDPTSVKWYRLDSVQVNNGNAYAPNSLRISGLIGFTSLDGCVCMRAEGYYIRVIKYADGTQPRTWSGTYRFHDNELSSESGDWTKATLAGDRLVLDAWDPWDEEMMLTWIYKEQQ